MSKLALLASCLFAFVTLARRQILAVTALEAALESAPEFATRVAQTAEAAAILRAFDRRIPIF